MGDLYGIRNSQLESHMNQSSQSQYDSARDTRNVAEVSAFNNGVKARRSKDNENTTIDGVQNLQTMSKVYTVGRAGVMGVQGGAAGAGSAYSMARSGIKAAPKGSFDLAESTRVATTAPVEGSVASSTVAGVKGAVSGTARGISDAGGAGQSVSEIADNLSGVEKIGGKAAEVLNIGKAGQAVAGKSLGAVGGIMTLGDQLDSLYNTGGKSMFDRTDSTGKEVRESGTDEAGQLLTEAGTVADVMAVASGGFLAPLAAAIGVVGGVVSAVGSYEDDKAADAAAGIGKDGKKGPAPKPVGQAISNAYGSLGMMGSQSHNPLSAIS